MKKITRDISGIRKSRRPSPMGRDRPIMEERRVKNNMASSNDYKVCTRWYVDNLFKNLTTWKKNDYKWSGDTKNIQFYELEDIRDDPDINIEIVDQETNKIYTLSEWKDSYNTIRKRLITGTKKDTESISFFEPIFRGTGLNTDVIQENSIIRIWSTKKRSSIGIKNAVKYGHTMITIDNPINNRRVSFGTWTDPEDLPVVPTEFYKKKDKRKINLDTDEIGTAHVINSPDNDFTSQIFRARNKNIDVNNFIELKAVGLLTKDHIENLKKVLIKDSYPLRQYTVDTIFRIKKSVKSQYMYVPSLSYYRQSSNLVYNLTQDLCFLGGGTILDENENILYRSKKRNRKLISINCASFSKLLFPDIVCVTKGVPSTLSKTFTGKKLLASPGGIYGKQTYDCTSNNNVKKSSSYIQYKESPGVFGVSGYVAAACILPWKINQVVAFCLRFLACAGASSGLYIIPIKYIPGGNIYNFILSASVLIGTTLNVFAYIKTNRNSLKFNYDDNTLEKNKNKLLQYYGKDNFVKLYNIYEKSLKSCKR